MAFNIRSRTGWHRLWLVAALVWTVAIVIIVLGEFPTRYAADSRLQNDLAKLTPQAVAKANEQYELRNKGHSYPFAKQYLTPLDVTKREQEAYDLHESRIASLKSEQKALIAKGLAFWLIPSLLLYVAGWLIAWIIRGFTR